MKLIIANWKMRLGIKESETQAKIFSSKLNKSKAEVVLCPTFVAISGVGKIIEQSTIKLGAQNCGWQGDGALTGEVMPKDLKQLGCEYVIIGHSERRHQIGEKEEVMNKKVISAIKNSLKVVLCVGETLAERREGEAFKVVQRQLKSALRDLPFGHKSGINIAYEPVWAIGTGISAKPEDALEMHKFIRKFATKILPKGVNLRIIYGGSVDAKNTNDFLKINEVDGLLVGGASVKAEFIDIVKKSEKL